MSFHGLPLITKIRMAVLPVENLTYHGSFAAMSDHVREWEVLEKLSS